MHRLFISLILLILGANSSLAFVKFEQGTLPLYCGSNKAVVEYRVSVDSSKPFTNKFAILIDGSPTTKFFSDNGKNFLKIADGLWAAGYKIFEIRYPKTNPYVDSLDSEGFYSVCFRQGMNNIFKHSADIYDSAAEKMHYDSSNSSHKMVTLGYSIGAVIVQSMAFTFNKKFDRIALTGVLVGDAVNGCLDGIKQLERFEEVGMSIEPEEFCQDERLSSGTSWAAFMDLAQSITVSGGGCCIETSGEFGSCAAGDVNEYTSIYNFEEQPYFANSKLAMFEGAVACLDPDEFMHSAASNTAQVNYISEIRSEKNAPTQIFTYQGCGHSVINCGGEIIVKDILGFLAPEAF